VCSWVLPVLPGRGGADCAQIEDVPCSKNCNGRGLCHREHCFCHNGYTGVDCSDLVSSLITVSARSAVAAVAQKHSALGIVMSAANRAGKHVNHHLHNSTSLLLAGVAAAALAGGMLTSVWWLRRSQ